jgi:hypothetical protein
VAHRRPCETPGLCTHLAEMVELFEKDFNTATIKMLQVKQRSQRRNAKYKEWKIQN